MGDLVLPRRGRRSALPPMALWASGGRPDRGFAAGGERFEFPGGDVEAVVASPSWD